MQKCMKTLHRLTSTGDIIQFGITKSEAGSGRYEDRRQ